MPNPTHQNQNKKRLGRGLDSLFGGSGVGTKPAETPPPLSRELTPGASTPTVGSAATPATAAAGASAPAGVTVADAPVTKSAPINEEAQIWKLPIEWIRPNTQQPRQVFETEAMKDLTASVRERGILQPIVARRLGEKNFEIIAGERRWRAAQAAGLIEVPVILKKASEQDSLELAIIENIQRSDLNPMDEAEAFDKLMTEYGLTQQEVANRLGRERSSVANSLRLLSLAAEVKALVRNRELSTGHAKVLAGVGEPLAQAQLARQAVAEKLSVRQFEKIVSARKTPAAAETTSAPTPAVSQRYVEGLASELQKLIGTKVAIDYAAGKGKINIQFYSDEQLGGIVEGLRSAWQK